MHVSEDLVLRLDTDASRYILIVHGVPGRTPHIIPRGMPHCLTLWSAVAMTPHPREKIPCGSRFEGIVERQATAKMTS
jgi:hypothetical protein